MPRWTVVLITLALLAAGGPAWAHAVLVETTPADGARLEAPPPDVRLRFNETVAPVSLRMLGPDGQALPLPDPVSENELLRIPLPADLPPGSYVVSYRVVSADGHPVAGSVLFGVGAAPDAAVLHAEEDRQATQLASLLVRALRYASLLAAAGGGLFLVLVLGRWSPVNSRLRPGLCLLVGAAALITVLNTGLAGAVLEDAPLSALAEARVWTTGTTSTVGFSTAITLLSLIALALGLALEARSVMGSILLLLGALGAALSLAATGHAATAPPRLLSTPLVVLHGLAVAFWLGALWPLSVVLRTEPAAEAARIVRRFSGLAIAAVALLVVAGLLLSLFQIVEPQALASTTYGQIWVAKIACVLVLLLLAAFNRFRLTPALEWNGDARWRLRGSVHTEIAVMVVILLLTVGLGSTPPPRVGDGHAHAAHEGHERHGEYPMTYTAKAVAQNRTAMIEVAPARAGQNRVTVRLTGPDGATLAAKEAVLEIALPDAGIEPITRPLTAAGDGSFTLDRLELPIRGRWSLRIDALISDFEKTIFRAELPVGE
jgi:copper transport protein